MYLLPQPRSVKAEEGQYFADYRRNIVIDSVCGGNVFLYAKMLQETLEHTSGLTMSILRGKQKTGDIFLTLDENLGEKKCYRLTIRENGVQVTGSNEEYLLYGIQTLRQICKQAKGILPAVTIDDYPDMENRGFYHDVTRGRVPKLAELKKLADLLCDYKMNQLQLYVEHTYMFRDFSEVWRDETPLTAEEILELQRYCKERHIDLVPSLSTFGHLYKLLSTKSYSEYCELEGSEEMPFSMWKRMGHHTVNVSNPGSIEMIKKMVEEYMGLFESRYFNICADETFDLCKGRSKYLTESQDVKDVYVSYVRELSEFVISKGKIPMFWGDVLVGAPEKIKDLPEENICLNWGYAAQQREYETEQIASSGATQYTCPGVCCWNEWIGLYFNAYENIRRMCSYAKKWNAVGVLNTDWGDFGHINQPEMSHPGLIYGAAFAWNSDHMEYEELCQRISVLEFGDETGSIMTTLSEIAGNVGFGWREVVLFHDMPIVGDTEEERKKEFLGGTPLESVPEKIKRLSAIRVKVQQSFAAAAPEKRSLLQKYLLGIDAILLWSRVRLMAAWGVYGIGEKTEDAMALAAELECWFMQYKDEWRKVSKEGDLRYISEIVFWYADLLRTMPA